MRQQLRRFTIGQTAKVMAVLYFLMGLIIILPSYLIASMYAPKGTMFGFGVGFAVVLPILYGIFGFIFVAIGCAIYNWVAGMVGGIEVQLESANPVS